MKRKVKDEEIIELLDKMHQGEIMTESERSRLYAAVVKRYRKFGIYDFFICAFDLIVLLAVAISSVCVMEVTNCSKYEALFCSAGVVLVLLCYFVYYYFTRKISIWLEKVDFNKHELEEDKQHE